MIVFAHGSSVESANRAVKDVTDQAAREGGFALASAAFLELAQPDLAAAVERLLEQGADRIVVVPYFLTPGIHLTRDLPLLIRELNERHPNLSIDVTPPLDGHPALRRILIERAQKAIECYPIKSHIEQS
jgi:sirohydrochlorin ferrochelatase